MLDWDDEELSRILWDEAPETVVPYRERNEGSHSSAVCKELINDLSSHELERKSVPTYPGTQGWVSESNSIRDSSTEKSLSCLGAETWKDPHLSSAVKYFHDSTGTNIAITAGTTQNLHSQRDGVAQFNKDSEISENQLEGHVGGDFVDYSWDDIGNFVDLDKLLSNDDPIFRNVGLGGVEELWSASKDLSYNLDSSLSFSSPVDSLIPFSESFGNVHMQNKVRTEYSELGNQSIHDYDQIRECIPHDRSNRACLTGGATDSTTLGIRLDQSETEATLSSPISGRSTLNKLSNKVNKRKKMKNCKEIDHKMKGKSLISPCNKYYLPENHLQQLGKQDAISMMHSYPFSEHDQLRQNAGYHQSNKFSVPCEYMHNQFPIMPILPQLPYGMGGLQQKLPAHEVLHGSSFLRTRHAPLKSQFMTPQEKIDKLRRRQQMQAMLAIKKQQQELGHEAPGLDIDRSVGKKHFHETHIETTDSKEKDSEETNCFHPYYDLSCASQKEIPNMASKAVNEIPMENSALTQLQDIIAKLDSQVKLCIRDSLFRLATSAAQRHYPSDISSARNDPRNEDYKCTRDEFNSHNRRAVMIDAETETNPVDRTVAHLLFHRPYDVIAKQSEKSNSASTRSLPGPTTNDLPTEFSKHCVELEQSNLPKESEILLQATEQQLGSEFLNSSPVEVSEKTASHEPCTEKPLT